MDQQALETARRYIDLLRSKNVFFESAWLWGSAVSGGFNADSDIDVGIIMKDVTNRFFMELDLMRYRRQIDLRIEPHIFSIEELESPLYFDFSKVVRLA